VVVAVVGKCGFRPGSPENRQWIDFYFIDTDVTLRYLSIIRQAVKPYWMKISELHCTKLPGSAAASIIQCRHLHSNDLIIQVSDHVHKNKNPQRQTMPRPICL